MDDAPAGAFSPAFLDWLAGVAYDDETDLMDLDTAELADLWYQVDALADVVRTVATKVRTALAETLDHPYTLPDGRVLKPGVDTVRTAWRQAELTERLFAYATIFMRDPETGESRPVLDPARVRGMFDPTHAVTKLRAAGVSPRDFCDESRANTITVIR